VCHGLSTYKPPNRNHGPIGALNGIISKRKSKGRCGDDGMYSVREGIYNAINGCAYYCYDIVVVVLVVQRWRRIWQRLLIANKSEGTVARLGCATTSPPSRVPQHYIVRRHFVATSTSVRARNVFRSPFPVFVYTYIRTDGRGGGSQWLPSGPFRRPSN